MPAKNPPKRALTDAQRGVRLIDASTGVTECRTCGNRWAEIAGELVALPERLQRGAARLTGRARSGPPAPPRILGQTLTGPVALSITPGEPWPAAPTRAALRADRRPLAPGRGDDAGEAQA